MRGKLEELIAAGFGKAAHYTPEENERYGGVNLNCCERILRGANIAYDLGMREEDMRVSAPFGGGMGIGSTCGAIIGALMALSMRHAGVAEKTTPLKEEVVVPFLERVRAELGALDCVAIKPRMAVEGDCMPTVLAVARLVDDAM